MCWPHKPKQDDLFIMITFIHKNSKEKTTLSFKLKPKKEVNQINIYLQTLKKDGHTILDWNIYKNKY